jgi:hypothetical protein
MFKSRRIRLSSIIDVPEALLSRRIPKNPIVPKELNYEDRLYTVF